MSRFKLKGRIIEKFGTISHFCEVAGISRPTASKIISGERTPKGLALHGWCRILDIPEDESGIFFADEVGKSQQREAR